MADDVTYTEDGLPIMRAVNVSKSGSSGQRWTGIFQIDGHSCDAVLEDQGISWSSLTGKGFKSKKKKKKKKKSKSSSKDESDSDCDDGCSLKMRNIVGVKVHYQRVGNQKTGDGICVGLGVFTFEKRDSCCWKDRCIVLGHPSKDLCIQWCSRISRLIQGFPERPKKIKIFLQPFAGKKYARTEYQKIQHLFEAAGIDEDMTELGEQKHMKDCIEELDLDKYDSIVCVGGDGTVSKMVSAVLDVSQEENGVEIRPGFSPQRALLPIGIIPVGTFNQIAFSIYGADDIYTAMRHILMGQQRAVNVCSIFNNEKFLQWAFNCHYGFFGSVLPFLLRYSLLGDKRIEASFIKALTKAKFRCYECEVQYVTVSDDPKSSNHPNDRRVCHKGCNRCELDLCEGRLSGTFTDVVQELGPLNSSNGSSIIAEMASESPYHTAKGEFINVSLFSLPARSADAPLGMSKYTHMNDGWIDLVMVKNTEKKEFVRFLKRHGNQKNQFDFPFVEAIRVKEVHFHARLRTTWKHVDHNFSEINYEIQRKEKTAQQNATQAVDTVEVIDDLQESESEDEDDSEDSISLQTASQNNNRGPTKEQKRGKALKKEVWSATNDGFRASVEEEDNENPDNHKASAWFNTSNIAEGTDTVMAVTDSYRPTIPELERARRGRDKKKKERKKKAKDESRMKSIWNIDNEICTDLDLHFKCHQGLVLFYGAGIPENHEPNDVKMGCLSFV